MEDYYFEIVACVNLIHEVVSNWYYLLETIGYSFLP